MATPTEAAKREYFAFLRGPVGFNTFAYGTVDDERGGVSYQGLLAEFPAPVDNRSDDFGIQEGGGFTIEISDEVHENGEADWLVLDEAGDPLLDEELEFIIEDY
jgi:hypothetical protein